MTGSNRTAIRLIYDGECPFCRRYVAFVRLNENYAVELVDARAHPGLYQELLSLGFDLDEGMVMETNDERYHGDECLQRLAMLTSRSGLLNRLNAWVFRSPQRSRVIYPWMVRGRNLVLRLLGTRLLGEERDSPGG
ncbi:MAG: DUF393 domain-containing protein [Pseudomonadaceae bacterium]|nr:DUF393 domain-containing protein [Pseudomonadaceae bacterium]